MIVELIIIKDYKTQDSYKMSSRCKVTKELNHKELCYLSW